MSRHLLRVTTAAAASLLLTAAAGSMVTPADAGTPPPYPVVASGLNNPRQLTFAHDGALYVAEAGVGAGTGTDASCLTSSEGGQVCYGNTGSIMAITGRGQHRVLTGLPSLAGRDGSQASGPSDIAMTGSQKFVVSVGLGNNPAVRDALPAGGDALGTLVQGKLKHGGTTELADIAGYEELSNPIDNPDSNPVSVLRQGSHYLVADAGGNTIVRTDHKGHPTTVAAFPDMMVGGVGFPVQFVPTSVAQGPDRAYYVSQLTGFPFVEGAASIWRVVPGEAPTPYASGLTNITDLAFAPDGSLYAVEIAKHGLLTGPIGALVHIPAGGGSADVVARGLFAPYGVALHRGSAYVTTGSVAPAAGQVIRIPLG